MTEETPATPELLAVTLVSDGWIKKYLLRYRLPDGHEFDYEAVSRKGPAAYEAELRALGGEPAHRARPDAVCIVPRTADNRLVLIREFRYALNSWTIAFPAGLLEADEPIESAVERELAEETGYPLLRDAAGRAHIRELSQPSYSSAGMSEESIQVVYAHVENEPRLGQHTEQIENIEVFSIAMGDVPAFLAANTTPIGTRAQLILESFANNLRRYGSAGE